MPDISTLAGWVLTIVFGITSLIQFIEDRATRRNIQSAKAIVDSISDTCNEALERPPASPEETRRMIVAIAHMSVAAKKSLDTMLPNKQRRN